MPSKIWARMTSIVGIVAVLYSFRLVFSVQGYTSIIYIYIYTDDGCFLLCLQLKQVSTKLDETSLPLCLHLDEGFCPGELSRAVFS